MTTQWQNFLTILMSEIRYIIDEDKLKDVNDVISHESNDIDSFFIYKMLHDREKYHSLTKALEKGGLKGGVTQQKIETCVKWVSNHDFKRVIQRLTIGKRHAAKMMDEAILDELNTDIFMDILMKNILVPYNDVNGTLSAKFKATNLLEEHQKRNIYWLWFLSVSFFFVNNIFAILQKKEYRMHLFESFGREVKKEDRDAFFIDYPIVFFPFTLRYMLLDRKLPERNDPSRTSTIYLDDINHLSYLVFDPFRVEGDWGEDVIFETSMSLDNISQSVLLNLKNHYNKNEEPGKRTFYNQLMKQKPSTDGLKTQSLVYGDEYYDLID